MNNSAHSRFVREAVEALPRTIQNLVPLEVSSADASANPWADLAFHLHGEGLDRTLGAEVIARTLLSRDLQSIAATRDQVHREHPDSAFLLVAPSIPEPLRRQMRSQGINHADLNGTIYIAEPGLVIRVDGPDRPARTPERSSRINPFSDKASLVLRVLLLDPARPRGVREVAEQVGISAGLVSMTAAELVKRGYAESHGGGLRLRDAAAALIDWLAAAAWDRSRVRSFLVPYEGEEIGEVVVPLLMREIASPIALTQLSGLDRYAPHVQHPGQYHMAVGAGAWDRVCEAVEEHAYGQPVSDEGNVHVVLPHAKHSALFDRRMIDGVPVVSPVQLFLDLSGYPLRGLEAAQMLLRTVLARELSLSREQVARLSSALE